jgi:phosphosulfolactate phosphohydrolase-like enzyme
MTNLHAQVLSIGQSFRAVGLSSPALVAAKGSILMTPRWRGERIVVVVGDAVRCSSTLMMAFGAGARSSTIAVKGGAAGTTDAQAIAVTERLGSTLVKAGELHGMPIAGGVMGNSPRAAMPDILEGHHVHFSTTNFGAAFTESARLVEQFNEDGGSAEIWIGSFVNARAVGSMLRSGSHDRVFLALGAFYDSPGLDDLVLGGDWLIEAGFPWEDLDDEARTMVLCARGLANTPDRLGAFRTGWIGQCLQLFGVCDDVAAVVSGQGVEVDVWNRAKLLVPRVRWIDGVPVLFPEPAPKTAAAEITN